MTASEEQVAGVPVWPFSRRPGDPLRVMPMRFERLGSEMPWSREVLLEVFRADQRAAAAAEVERERQRRSALDWTAFVPIDEPSADDPREAPAGPGPVSALPDPEDRRADRSAASWRGYEASARIRADAGELSGMPTAAEYAGWSDERITALSSSIHPVDDDLDDAEEWDDEAAETLDAHPILVAMDEVERAQRQHREAEVLRVQAAVSAWRVAEAAVTGTVDASPSGMYFRSVIMDLAHRLQVAERTATILVTSAMALEEKTPKSWHAFLRGDVPWRAMQMVHARLEGLEDEKCAAFDVEAAKLITTVALPKLKKRLRTARERVQAETATERHKKAMAAMRVTIDPLDDGMIEISAVVPAPEGVSIDQRLDLVAREAAAQEGETRSIAELRAHAFLDVLDEGLFRGATRDLPGIAIPTRRGVQAKIGVLVPLATLAGKSTALPTLDGYGPIDIDTAKRLLGTAKSFARLLTDPVTGMVKDIGRTRYRPTTEMRTFLGIVDGGGRGPNSDRPPSQTQIDHIRPYRQGLARGSTALDNLVLLAILDHRIKTSGFWEIELRDNRDLAWTSFYGTRIITTIEPPQPTSLIDQPVPF